MPRRFAPRLFLTISQKVKIGGGGGIRTRGGVGLASPKRLRKGEGGECQRRLPCRRALRDRGPQGAAEDF